MSEYSVRGMRRGDVDWAVEMAAGEGWNPGVGDAEAFYAQDSGGFLIGEMGGEAVGCISAVKYGDAFGFIGFYIVRPDMRGKGYGIRLWNAAMQRLEGRVVGLDGVIEQQGNYRKSGFALQYSNIRYEYRNALHAADRDAAHDAARDAGSAIEPAGAADLEAIAEYERPLFPAERDAFLRAWTAMPGTHTLTARESGTITGYGTIRPCRVGYKIGPLFADTPQIAEALFRSLCARAEADALIYLDVPEVNAPGMALAKTHGMQKVFGTARMYTQTPPTLETARIFGVTSFELG